LITLQVTIDNVGDFFRHSVVVCIAAAEAVILDWLLAESEPFSLVGMTLYDLPGPRPDPMTFQSGKFEF